MQTLQPTETAKVTAHARRPRLAAAIAVAVVVVVGAAVAIWAVTNDGGPVAADDATIELTFTGDDASFVGDREITQGRADAVLINDSTEPVWFVIQYFEPESADIDLARYPEGTDMVVSDDGPAGDVVVMESISPGSVTRSILLEPGTYIVEAAADAGEDTVHVWRAAVIEVVSG